MFAQPQCERASTDLCLEETHRIAEHSQRLEWWTCLCFVALGWIRKAVSVPIATFEFMMSVGRVARSAVNSDALIAELIIAAPAALASIIVMVTMTRFCTALNARMCFESLCPK